jgi:hypothetical protein
MLISPNCQKGKNMKLSKMLFVAGFILTTHMAQAKQCSEDQVVQSFNETKEYRYASCFLEAQATGQFEATVIATCESGDIHEFTVVVDNACQISSIQSR